MDDFLLTIGIPTYNRSGYLDKCLDSIITQIKPEYKIEMLISDNASTDQTKSIVDKYASLYPIKYSLSEVNQGPDPNIAKCFDQAKGKYVWIFGDDDFLMPKMLEKIIGLLKNSDYGMVKLMPAPYYTDEKEIEQYAYFDELKYVTYNDPLEYLARVNYWVTFITGTIVNKSLVKNLNIDYFEFLKTNLIQINWTIQALFQGKPNIWVDNFCVGCKQDNSGGYRLVTTFSKNYNFILRALVKKGYDKKIIDLTNTKLLTEYFPLFIPKLLEKGHDYEGEDSFKILLKCFWRYPEFWKNVFPLFLKNYLSSKKVKN